MYGYVCGYAAFRRERQPIQTAANSRQCDSAPGTGGFNKSDSAMALLTSRGAVRPVIRGRTTNLDIFQWPWSLRRHSPFAVFDWYDDARPLLIPNLGKFARMVSAT